MANLKPMSCFVVEAVKVHLNLLSILKQSRKDSYLDVHFKVTKILHT